VTGGSPWRPAAVKYSCGECARVSGWRSSRGCRRRGRGSSEGDRDGNSQWLNDGKHSGVVAVKRVKEEKRSLHGGRGRGCSFYNRWRRLANAARAVGGEVAAAKPWAWQSGGGHGPNGCAIVQTGRLMGGPQRFQFFFQFIQNRMNFKNPKPTQL
jgi:hypothetical protein